MNNKCLKCFRKKENCICDQVEIVETPIKFIILMHPMEARRKKTTGTGRLANLCLKDSEIIVGIDFTQDRRVNELIEDERYFPCILYPGEKSHNISLKEFDLSFFDNKIPLIFLIDGTWPCAKKMMKLSVNLHLLPKISFDVKKESLFLTKQQPMDLCLSTIEAIYYCLDELKKIFFVKNHETLLNILKTMVNFQIKCALDPNLESYKKKKVPYKKPHERKRTQKWEKRKLFFS